MVEVTNAVANELIRLGPSAPSAEVPIDARLEDAAPGTALLDAAARLRVAVGYMNAMSTSGGSRPDSHSGGPISGDQVSGSVQGDPGRWATRAGRF